MPVQTSGRPEGREKLQMSPPPSFLLPRLSIVPPRSVLGEARGQVPRQVTLARSPPPATPGPRGPTSLATARGELTGRTAVAVSRQRCRGSPVPGSGAAAPAPATAAGGAIGAGQGP